MLPKSSSLASSLLFYYNVYFEPKIHRMFAKYEERERLTWWWRFHVDHEGSNDNAIVHERRVKVKGKPMMWFVKGKRRLTDSFVSNAIHSTKPDKDKHPWAQSQVEAEYLVKMLTISEDSLVVDPFLGSGAFAIPAIKLGRYFIGVEKDTVVYERAKGYIAQETAAIGAVAGEGTS